MKFLKWAGIVILALIVVVIVLALVSDQSFWLYQHNYNFQHLSDALHGR